MAHAEDLVGDSNGVYVWECPNGDGSYSMGVLQMSIPKEDFESSMSSGDVLRRSFFGISAPIQLVDPDDIHVRVVADHIERMTAGTSERNRAEAALNFVQTAIRYTSDSELYGTAEFWATPVETLYLHRGDCEDAAVLLCSILGAMGIEWALLDYVGHEAVGVYLEGSENRLYCEATGGRPTPVGWMPSELQGAVPDEYRKGDRSASADVLAGVLAGSRGLIQRIAGV